MTETADQPPNKPVGGGHTDDWHGVGEAIAVTTSRVSAPVEGMHRAILGRWGGLLGTKLEGERSTIDELIGSMYGMIRLGGAAVGTTIAAASDLVDRHAHLPPVWATGRGKHVQSVLNAVWGDQLEDDGSPLRIGIALRDGNGMRIDVTVDRLRHAYPDATGRLAVMLHGLGETEQGWYSDSGLSLPEGLETDGFTALGLRYNTGLDVATSGSGVSDLLEEITDSWPIPVEEIVLIGHAMGGLVAMSAVESGRASDHRWPNLASHLVAIATPHLGSPIEKGVEALSRGLERFGVTAPLSEFVSSRSAGIKDLRFGTGHEVEGVRTHLIAGAVTEEATHPMGRLVGDLVVRVASATGQGRWRRVESSNSLVLGGRNHARMLADPEVVAHTRSWLTQDS